MSELVPEIPDMIEIDSTHIAVEESSKSLSQRLGAAVRAGQWALAMMEVLPSNEVIRVALFGGGEYLSRNPLVGAASIGLSTFAVEAIGGVAAAGLMNNDTDKGRDLSEALSKKSLQLPFIHKDIMLPRKLNRTSKLGWTLIGGTVIGMGLEQRENPERTRTQNRLYSLYTSAWLGGAVALPGFLAAEGIDAGLNNPAVGGGIASGLIVLGATGRWAKNKFFSRKPIEEIPITEEAI